jgi:hypothetical protein
MLKYVSKFALDILPSVAATIIGAYIVNHYIVSKPGADAPVAAAVSTADPKIEAKTEAKTEPKAEAKAAPGAAKPAEASSDLANVPEVGGKARGASEKAVLEKPAEKSDKPAETASIPVETRRHQPAPREKAARIVPAPVQPAPAVAAPVMATPTPPPPVEAAVTPDERRDANGLARAAIERLRGGNEGSSRAQEAARTPDPPRTPDASRASETPRVVLAPAVRPLPPPIMVSTPGNETLDPSTASSQTKPPYAASVRIDVPNRPTPPADIPASRPLDLRAEGPGPTPRDHTSVAEEMLSAAKSVFHAVLPK